MTVSAWVRTEQTVASGNRQGILCIADSATPEAFDFYLTGNNAPAVWFSSNDDTLYGYNEANTQCAANTWYHILWQRVAWNNYQWYVDGSEDENYQDFSATTDDDLLVSPDKVSIGSLRAAGVTSTYGFEGDIADVCIFNTVLSAADIAHLAGGGDPRAIAGSGLVHYWPLDNLLVPNYGSIGNAGLTWSAPTATILGVGPPALIRSRYLPVTPGASAVTHEEAGTLALDVDISGVAGIAGTSEGTLGIDAGLTSVGELTGQVYYALDPTSGNDGTAASSTSSATAQTMPWKTFSALNTALMSPSGGHAHIIVKKGETVSGASELTKDGTSATERIMIEAYGTGAAPIFDGGTNTWALRVRNYTHITDQVEITSTAGDEGRKAISIPNNHGEDILIECDIDAAAGVQIIDSGTSLGLTIQNNTITCSDGDCVSILSNTAGTVTMQDGTYTSDGGTNGDCWQVANAATCPVVARRLNLWKNHTNKQAVTIGGAISSLVCEELDFYTTITSGTRPDGFIIRNGGGDITCTGFRFHDEYEICFRVTDEVGGLQGDCILQGAYLLQREGSTSPCLRVDEDSGNLHGTHDVIFSNITIPQGNNCFYVAVDNASPSWTLRYENCIFQQTTTSGGGYVMRLGGAGSLLPNLSSACNNNILKGATHVSGTYILSNSTEHTTLAGHQAEFSIQGIDDASEDELITFQDSANDDYTPDAPSAAYQGGKAVGGGSVYYDLTTVTDPENIGSHPGGWAFVHEETGTVAVSGDLVGASSLTAAAAGTLSVSGDLTGTGSMSADVAGLLALDSGATGLAALLTDQSGTLGVDGGLTGSSSMTTDQAGTLSATLDVTGLQARTTEGAGTLGTIEDITGVTSMSTEAAGLLALDADFVGARALVTDQAGALGLDLAIAGTAAGLFEVAGALPMDLGLSGVGVGVFDEDGTLSIDLTLSGLSALSVEGAGTLALDVGFVGSGTSIYDESGAVGLVVSVAGASSLVAEVAGSLPLELTLVGVGETLTDLEVSGALGLTVAVTGTGAMVTEQSATLSLSVDAVATAALIAEVAGTLSTSLDIAGAVGLVLEADGSMSIDLDLTSVAATTSALEVAGALGLQAGAVAAAIATLEGSGDLAIGSGIVGAAIADLGAAGALGLQAGVVGLAGQVLEDGGTVSVVVDMTGINSVITSGIAPGPDRTISIKADERTLTITGIDNDLDIN